MGGWVVVPMVNALEVPLGPLRPHAATGLERRVGAVLAELGFRGNDGRLTVPVGITLVGGTGDQLWEKSRFQKASHWPFSLR